MAIGGPILNSNAKVTSLLVFILGIAVTATIWKVRISSEVQAEVEKVESRLNIFSQEIKVVLRDNLKAVERMAKRWEFEEGLSRASWENDAQNYIKDVASLQALEWVDSQGYNRWIIPLEGNEAALNLDLKIEPRTAVALLRAKEEKKLQLTKTVELVQGGKGFLGFDPLFVGKDFQGYIVGVFKVDNLVDGILKESNIDFPIQIFEGDVEIFQHAYSESTQPSSPSAQANFNFQNLNWVIGGNPDIASITLVSSGPLTAGIISIIATLFITLLCYLYLSLRKKNDDLVLHGKLKSEFLANMSHEIRTPMTAILGYTEALHEDNLSEQERIDAHKMLLDSGHYLLNLINDLLDLSKIEASKIDIEKIECSPAVILKSIKTLLTPNADNSQVKLKFKFETPIPKTIVSDPTRLRQVLVNLVGNAIKFTPKNGTVTVKCSTVRDIKDQSPILIFDVNDTGIGISEEQLQRIFLPFSQADSSTTRKYGGTGLGLTISKQLIEIIGGELSVSSTLGEGSSFTVSLPLATVDENDMVENWGVVENPPAPAKSSSKHHQLNGLRILVAEDNGVNQKLISRILKKFGAEFTVVNNGEEAVIHALNAAYENAAYDVILMDMQMPILDGYEATRVLRRENYTHPIIALTAHAGNSDKDTCLLAGCDDYTTKPYNSAQILEVINETIARVSQSSQES